MTTVTGGSDFVSLAERERRLKELDLSMVCKKLMMPFPEGFGWSERQALEAEKWYKRFLWLVIVEPKASLVPNPSIDVFWHAHILHTKKYFQDCSHVLGRPYLHHDPGFGAEGDEAALSTGFDGTLALYRKHFGGEDCTEMQHFEHPVQDVASSTPPGSSPQVLRPVAGLHAVCGSRCSNSSCAGGCNSRCSAGGRTPGAGKSDATAALDDSKK